MNDIVTPVADPFIKKRIDFIDPAKGFCIILVVLYHICQRVIPPSPIDSGGVGCDGISYRRKGYRRKCNEDYE